MVEKPKPRAADVLFGGAAPKPKDPNAWRQEWLDAVVRDAFERSGGSITMEGIMFTRKAPKPARPADRLYGKDRT